MDARRRGPDVAFSVERAFLKKKAEDPANRAIVGEALRALTGGRWRLSYELRDELDAASGDGAPREYTEDEWVRALQVEEFDAEEIPVEPGPPSPGRRARGVNGERRSAIVATIDRGTPGEKGALMAKQPRMPNMQQMMEQVQKMQQDMELAQEELAHRRSSRPPPAAAW